MEAWRSEVIAEAKTWMNTPYVPKARIKGLGVDCGGLLYEVYNPFFGPFPPIPDYMPDWANNGTVDHYLDFIMPICDEVSTPQPGDFSLIHMGKFYSHAAILLDNGRYIHSWGRLREGNVTQSNIRIITHLAKSYGKPLRHFSPRKS